MPRSSALQQIGLQSPKSRTRLLGRNAATLFLVAASVWIVRDCLSEMELSEIWQHLRVIAPLQWLGALGLTAVAFYAVGAQEAEVNAWLGLSAPNARSVGIAAAAISQTSGFGPIVGTLVRLRLRRDLSLAQAIAVTGAVSILFLVGLGIFALLANTIVPHELHADERAWLLLALAALAACIAVTLHVTARQMPPLTTGFLLRMAAFVTLDIVALCLSFWILMPGSVDTILIQVIPVFALALGAGLLSGSPAGAGPFEAIVLAHLAIGQENEIAAGVIAFRLVSYILPATLGMCWVIIAPLRDTPLQDVVSPDPAQFAQAELQISRQGNFALAPLFPGAFWLSARLLLGRIWMGDPVAPSSANAACAERALAAAQGIGPALFYRIGPRCAALARRRGLRVFHLADEAILAPQSFCLKANGRAGLRRKLKKALKAGLHIEAPDSLPLSTMNDVHRKWSAKRGGQRGFTMGIWDETFIQEQKVFLAWDSTGNLQGFVSFHTSRSEWVLDLVRFRPSAPDGALYLLVHSAIEAGRAAGIQRLSLAAVPAAPTPGMWGSILAAATYGTRGLRQFKEAFKPSWEPRYVAATSHYRLLLLLALTAWRVRHP